MSAIDLRLAWKKDDPVLRRDAEAVWNALNTVYPREREDRLKELVAVAYEGEKVVGTCTARAIERSSFENLRKQEESSGFKEKPDKAERFFRSGKSGQWQDKLSRRQVREIVSAHHQQMQRFGYLTKELKHLVE